jgi:hypothetical protein
MFYSCQDSYKRTFQLYALHFLTFDLLYHALDYNSQVTDKKTEVASKTLSMAFRSSKDAK